MKLIKFDSTASPSINRKFRGIKTAKDFAKTFTQLTDQANSDPTTPQPSTQAVDKTTNLNPNKRRKVTASMEHSVLLPATRRKEITNNPGEETSTYDEEEMDNKIQDHFIGKLKF